jgi:hypothetical protein
MISDLSLPSLLKKALTQLKIPLSDQSRKRTPHLIQRQLFPDTSMHPIPKWHICPPVAHTITPLANPFPSENAGHRL